MGLPLLFVTVAALLSSAGPARAAGLADLWDRDDPPMRFKAVIGPYAGYTEMYRAKGAPWGKGKMLTAVWSHSVGVGAELGACSSIPGKEVVFAETPKGEDKQVLHRLGPDGKEIARAKTSGDAYFVDAQGRKAPGLVFKGRREFLLAGETGGVPALVLRGGDELDPVSRLKVVDLEGKEAVKVGESANRPLWADLDGDGRKELVATGPRDAGGSVRAYDAKGRLWSRDGLADIAALAAGRLGAGPGESLLAFTDPPKDPGTVIVLLDGKGAVVREVKDDREIERAAYLRSEGKSALVAEVARLGHDRPLLRIRSWKDGAPVLVAEADLGWTDITALAAADLDGDGRKEIFLATSTGWVVVYDEKARLIAERSYNQALAGLTAADLRGDGKQAVLVAIGGGAPWVHAVGLMPIPEGKSPRGAP